MKKVISNTIFLAVLLGTNSCTHSLPIDAYIQYVQNKEHGLKKTVQVTDWEYAIQYKPYDYIILMENKGNRKAFDVSKRKDELKGTAWFNISFKLADGRVSPMRYNLSSKDEYDQRLNYFLNGATHNIRLIYGGRDTLRPIGYLFENNYNLTPQETIVVGFALPGGETRPQKDMQLSYNDEAFKNGIIKAIYKKQDLQDVPNLIY
jgi:hypothetical protein